MHQISLFDLENTTERTQSWFQSAMDLLELKESPGWPDCFGYKFNAWISSQGLNSVCNCFLDYPFHLQPPYIVVVIMFYTFCREQLQMWFQCSSLVLCPNYCTIMYQKQ